MKIRGASAAQRIGNRATLRIDASYFPFSLFVVNFLISLFPYFLFFCEFPLHRRSQPHRSQFNPCDYARYELGLTHYVYAVCRYEQSGKVPYSDEGYLTTAYSYRTLPSRECRAPAVVPPRLRYGDSVPPHSRHSLFVVLYSEYLVLNILHVIIIPQLECFLEYLTKHD